MKKAATPERVTASNDDHTSNESNGLIALAGVTATILTMSSREIAELTGKRHDNVLRDTESMLDSLNIEQTSLLSFDNSGANGRKVKFYKLPKDLTLTLVSGYNIQLRKRIIDRWLELEEQPQSQQIPSNFADALLLASNQARQLEQQQTYIEHTKHQVEFAQAVSTSKTGVSLGEFAKTLGIGPNKLFAWLREQKILMTDSEPRYSNTHNVPYQKFINAGYFTVRRGVFTTNHGRERSYTTLITGKGEVWLTRRLKGTDILPNSLIPHQQ